MRLIPTLIAVSAVASHVGAVKAADYESIMRRDSYCHAIVGNYADTVMGNRQFNLYVDQIDAKTDWQIKIMEDAKRYAVKIGIDSKYDTLYRFTDKWYAMCQANKRHFYS